MLVFILQFKSIRLCSTWVGRHLRLPVYRPGKTLLAAVVAELLLLSRPSAFSQRRPLRAPHRNDTPASSTQKLLRLAVDGGDCRDDRTSYGGDSDVMGDDDDNDGEKDDANHATTFNTNAAAASPSPSPFYSFLGCSP